jgi:L-rhamnose mutarotase
VQSYAQVIDLVDDPEIIEQYEEYHRNVWPEVVASLKEIGITAMKIYRVGNHLFMYYETVDGFQPERDFQSYTEKNPRANEWNDLMSRFQRRIPEAGETDWWTAGKLVYNLEWQ